MVVKRMIVQKPEEDHKPLIICTHGPVEGTPEKLVVDIETLSFQPASGQQLQTARRGKLLNQEIYVGGVGVGV